MTLFTQELSNLWTWGQNMRNLFRSKGTTPILETKVRFNGIEFCTVGGEAVLDQRYYIEYTQVVTRNTSFTFEDFRSARAKLAYATYSACPDFLVFIAYLTQFTKEKFLEEKEEAMRIMRKADKTIRASPSRDGLKLFTSKTRKWRSSFALMRFTQQR